jgi:hypothetical protein
VDRARIAVPDFLDTPWGLLLHLTLYSPYVVQHCLWPEDNATPVGATDGTRRSNTINGATNGKKRGKISHRA